MKGWNERMRGLLKEKGVREEEMSVKGGEMMEVGGEGYGKKEKGGKG